ncbi:uncharacterized protein PRCAT00000361001 [Priceomyces carsonii]|uniref:uncharacterized protein n=1 Tax=Priceomyces carsonii TaxID=28549 RepID=UPI002ED85A01|nr:unnamed protein product [Priceomyces carsonii]
MRASIIHFISALVFFVGLSIAGLSSEELLELTRKSGKSRTIEIDELNYQSILGGKRDYHLILLLSSTSPQINCALCNELKPEFELVASSWFADHPNGLSEKELESEDESTDTRKNIYFAYSEYFNSKSLFATYKLNSIPKIFYFSPTSNPDPQNFVKEYDDYQFYVGGHADLLANYITKVTGFKVNLYVPINYNRIATNVVVTFVVALLVFKFKSQVLQLITSKTLWSSASLVGILFLISGYMFNQIRGVPYVREHQNGAVEYFLAGQQNQLGIETQIIAFIYGILGVLVVVLLKKVPEIHNAQLNVVAVIIVSGLIFVFYSILLSIFGLKGMGYPYKFISFF